MAEDLTSGEIRRSLERLERAQVDAQRAVDDRMNELARKTVPAELWAAEHRALQDDVKHLEADFHEAVDRIERSAVERKQVLEADINKVRRSQENHEKEHRDDSTWSRNKKLTVIAIVVGAAATLAGAWIAAVLAAKGVS